MKFHLANLGYCVRRYFGSSKDLDVTQYLWIVDGISMIRFHRLNGVNNADVDIVRYCVK